MICGIYKITNKINGHCYIGQSINITERWRHHRNYPLENSHYPLYKAFRLYGIENFSWEILEECPIDELDEKEIYYISYYNSYYDGYNQTQGGQGNRGNVIKLSLEDINIIYDLLQNTTVLQNDIAKMFNVGIDTISEINQGKTRINPTLKYPLRDRHKSYCKKCGKKISNGANYCLDCKNLLSRTVERPDREKLKELIRTNSFLNLSKQFNVSDNAIRKWCKNYNLPFRKTEIKKYSDEEWSKI